jgi:hypothetical protein
MACARIRWTNDSIRKDRARSRAGYASSQCVGALNSQRTGNRSGPENASGMANTSAKRYGRNATRRASQCPLPRESAATLRLLRATRWRRSRARAGGRGPVAPGRGPASVLCVPVSGNVSCDASTSARGGSLERFGGCECAAKQSSMRGERIRVLSLENDILSAGSAQVSGDSCSQSVMGGCMNAGRCW